ncbi:MAG: hypothetical protein CR975_02100 [Gammaproteobacteria bacterium]|nr:MAG: hypothetical protein CR975_02100 [Gammaproteobacteria bacterium]
MSYPTLIESLDYELILANLLDKARDIPGWTAELESDPVVKLLEIVAYRELGLRAHINHVAISNLVQFAKGDDLDAAAAFYQIVRLPDESDQRFRNRLFAHIRGLAGNGTRESYHARAMAAHSDVIDVAVYRLAPGKINIAVWGSNAAVIAVKAALTAPDKEMLGIDVNVFAAKQHVIDVAATVFVSHNAPLDVDILIIEQLRDCARRETGFGRPLAVSQLVAWLHEPLGGTADIVNKVQISAPMADINVDADELWAIGSIDLRVVRDRI